MCVCRKETPPGGSQYITSAKSHSYMQVIMYGAIVFIKWCNIHQYNQNGGRAQIRMTSSAHLQTLAPSQSNTFPYHMCRMGTDVCFMATSAPPQSRNQTLYSSSKICKQMKYCMSVPLHWEVKSQKKSSTRLHAFLCCAKHTCLQELPPSEEMNTPTSVQESSEPILPATQVSDILLWTTTLMKMLIKFLTFNAGKLEN